MFCCEWQKVKRLHLLLLSPMYTKLSLEFLLLGLDGLLLLLLLQYFEKSAAIERLNQNVRQIFS